MSYEKRSYSRLERAQLFAAFSNVEVSAEESMVTSEVVETDPDYGKYINLYKICIFKNIKEFYFYKNREVWLPSAC